LSLISENNDLVSLISLKSAQIRSFRDDPDKMGCRQGRMSVFAPVRVTWRRVIVRKTVFRVLSAEFGFINRRRFCFDPILIILTPFSL
jgi:hypothetical protein